MNKFMFCCALTLVAGGSAQAAIYSNGSLITNPTGGFGGAPISELTSPASTFGFGATSAANNRLADDFTITDAAGWNINSLSFFGYLTGSTTTSPATAVNYRIWSGGAPGAGGSILFDFSASNQMTSTGWTGIYRVLSTTPLATNRPIMEMVAAGNSMLLGPGTYWVDFQYAGVSFTPPIVPASGPGNAVQFLGTTSTWGPAIDTGSALQQEMPFTINYTVAPGPGSLGLLGVGGLLAKRRRRS